MFYKSIPEAKEYIWAGRKLKSEYSKVSDLEKISETWELSVNKNGLSFLDINGSKVSLKEYAESNSLGKNLGSRELPMLIKLIDSDDDLSIQVHPSDEYALKNENSLGKTEMWYIVDHEPGGFIYLGFKDNYTKEEVEFALRNGKITDLLNKIEVNNGDFFVIPSGTIHAIGKGITIYEIQENSDLTYRLYDFDRVDKNGNKRELHIDKALNVLKYEKYDLGYLKEKNRSRVLTANEYFELMKANIKKQFVFNNNENSFALFTFIKGSPLMNGVKINKGESYFIEPNTEIKIEGEAEVLIARYPDLAVGLDVGGTSVKGLIIDDLANKVSETKVSNENAASDQDYVNNMAQAYFNLIKNLSIKKDFFKSLGVGFPGNIDSKNGIVVFSNNLGIHNSPISKMLKEKIGIDVIIDNDANCAALGEFYYTDKREYKNMVLLTLGTGIGSGVILDGKLFKGGQGSIVEIGHMKVKSDKVQCTCGQYGCLESLISLARIKKDVDELRMLESTGLAKLISDEDTPLNIFSYGDTNDAAREYIRKYQNNLLLGLTNICNIFQPELIALGGGVSYRIVKMIPSLEYRMNKFKYSGFDSPKVKLVQASLGNDAGGYGACALTKN